MKMNDTYGLITDGEHAELRSVAKSCSYCGMLATVDPELHARRYGHAPEIRENGSLLRWGRGRWQRV